MNGSALKSFFLGPQSENAAWVEKELKAIFQHWFDWRQSLFPKDGRSISLKDMEGHDFRVRQKQITKHVQDLLHRFDKEIPLFSPRYIGHILSEISLSALLGHIITLLYNPNNVTEEVSRVGSQLEDEAIAFLLEMIGYDSARGRGHFTSGGTIANFEALWRARYRLDHWMAMGSYLRSKGKTEATLFTLAHQGWKFFYQQMKKEKITEDPLKEFSFVASSPWMVAPRYKEIFGHHFLGPVALIPRNKHYSWQKGVSLLGFGSEAFWPVELDKRGKICVKDLRRKIEKARKENRPVLMVVSVAGTTEMGEIDPVHHVQELLDHYRKKERIHVWHHVDAAYGGFFCSLLKGKKKSACLSKDCISSLQALARADSVTVDPHKLGYVPYASGAFLVKDDERYLTSSFAAAYLLRSKGGNKWLRTLEGSRSAAGAVATWLTAKSIGFNAQGYGRILEKTITARKKMEKLLRDKITGCQIAPHGDTNLLCFLRCERRGEVVAHQLSVCNNV